MDLKESPQLHIFTLANIVQRPIIVYAHPDSPVGYAMSPILSNNVVLQWDLLTTALGHARKPIPM